MSESRITHPNRDKPESKAMKAVVTFLLLASAGLIAAITFGGWKELQGAQPVAVVYIIVYLILAWFVVRWQRGVLPVAAALSILFAVMAAVAAPAWFARDKEGFDDPALPPELLGMLTVVLVGVLLLLTLFSMRAFSQKWNVEVEEGGDEEPDRWSQSDEGTPSPAGA